MPGQRSPNYPGSTGSNLTPLWVSTSQEAFKGRWFRREAQIGLRWPPLHHTVTKLVRSVESTAVACQLAGWARPDDTPQRSAYLDTRNSGNGDETQLCKEDGSGAGLSYLVINRVVTRWIRRHLGVRLTPHRLTATATLRGPRRGHPRDRRGARPRLPRVHRGRHAGLVRTHSADRRVI